MQWFVRMHVVLGQLKKRLGGGVEGKYIKSCRIAWQMNFFDFLIIERWRRGHSNRLLRFVFRHILQQVLFIFFEFLFIFYFYFIFEILSLLHDVWFHIYKISTIVACRCCSFTSAWKIHAWNFSKLWTSFLFSPPPLPSVCGKMRQKTFFKIILCRFIVTHLKEKVLPHSPILIASFSYRMRRGVCSHRMYHFPTEKRIG